MRSARKHSVALSLSVLNARQILLSKLKFLVHKLMVARELLERDHKTRIGCCKDILENIPANAVLITSDEAHFYLSGFDNKQNFRYWSESNPTELQERPSFNEQVTMWCAVANFGIYLLF